MAPTLMRIAPSRDSRNRMATVRCQASQLLAGTYMTTVGIKGEPGSTLKSTALVVIAVCCAIALLYFAHAVFIPIVLSLLFALVLSSAVEALHRHCIPRALSAILMLTVLVTVLGATLYAVSGPATQWFDNLPQTLKIIEKKVQPARQLIARIEVISHRAGSLTDAAPPKPVIAPPAAPAAPIVAPSPGSTDVLLEAREGIISTMSIIILTLFLLSGGPPMLARMMAAFAKDMYATQTLKVIEAIRRALGRYYGSIALINIGLGVATGLTMMLLGLPNPFLWGTMAAVLNFVPYIGSATTLVVLGFVAAVSFDDIAHVLAVMGSYLAIATLEGQVVQPLLVGHRLEINPVLVFLAVWCGGWMWGIAGIAIAVPALVALKVGAQHSQNGAALRDFLSPKNTVPLTLRSPNLRRGAKARPQIVELA
jgi:predicted PurR-regulated permease PerM